MVSETDPPPAKKAKTILAKSWKLFLTENLGRDSNCLYGLQDLFAHGFDSTGYNSRRTTAAGPTAAAANAARHITDRRGAHSNKFHTLRLEHRTGGPMAQFRGEERILLFRSDRPGAIAKIIYSSELPEGGESFHQTLPSPQQGNSKLESQLATAQAKIHVLDVKSQYRGRDLGGLLFSEAITSLKSKYCNDDDEDVSQEGGYEYKEYTGPVKSNGCSKQVYDVKCVLDAEEDATRYGKLVSFYEHLGCRVRSSKRVQYVNNNDSETYRKVPMQIDLHPPNANSLSNQERVRLRRRKFSHLVSSKGSFLPVKLVGSLGKLSVRCHASQEIMKSDWLVTETPEGIQFYTTHGHLLLAGPGGSVSVLSPADQDIEDDSDLDIDTNVLNRSTRFVPCLISDADDTEGDDRSQNESSKSLWVLRTCHGTFLTADSLRQTLSCTRLPSFWQASGANLSLVCTSDTPPRRHHYRKCWKFQTYDYVRTKRLNFLNFSLGRATLIEALGWIHAFPAHPFHSWSSDGSISGSTPDSAPSLRTLCFLMAETAREEGLPDWVQLVALFHELGEAVKILDPSNTGQMADSIYDWTISSRSRVVGCKIPQCATFGEFRHLNMDEEDSRYNSDTGVYQANCGLENVFLMWSGCEYMYYLLKHNRTSLPEEVFAMIRFFLLGDWYEHGEYSSLVNADDEDMLPFLQEFDALRRSVRVKCLGCGNLTDDQCSYLWDNHYVHIAEKYKCTHVFSW
mmetsp:Transcript_22827/g.43048  ORF Transcript_22827/g.43048 Transcript_22827/m.43048 type:complete len:738 (-) Transcript_22827:300-2513(-)|eukprot:CAMPEP_0201663136 /NCGR_PEP_ID=MMETSP0494-20130426/5018_1 /ASSEMBLY_ACC=CAM_ASM_000839 /TAXON_ID=420259 /ORGANISM="Thalassiosira gravida, Strain GMp14c1" /LENGTH=737 /DNA_ID=CAMNT_0048141657 /DNA_START=239 /DNA_END=2452 /DNA_ORIENTATION=-